MSLQDTQNLAPGDTPHLSNAMRITKNDTNLRGCQTLLGKLADILLNLMVITKFILLNHIKITLRSFLNGNTKYER